MYCKRFSFVAFLGVGLLVTLGLLRDSAMAEKPVPVVRTFGIYVTGEVVPDFEGEDSIKVKVEANPGVADTFIFADCERNPEWLRGTVWNAQSARHVKKGSDEELGSFFWLETEECPDPPEKGAQTFTGPDSLILPPGLEVYTIRMCDTTECGYGNEGKWIVDLDPANGRPFVVVTAISSK